MINLKNNKILLTLVAILVAIALWFAFFSRVTPPDFSQYQAGPERKTAFFGYFSPLVADVNKEILADRAEVKEVCTADVENNAALSDLAVKYRVDKTDVEKESLCTV
ncbi:MAG TPA: flagellar biosynthesis protein FlgJ, partial [Alteromonas sp.]|nr:flagellar biosynthesis protein FlgJ [Alteromonas sp.]